MSPLFRLYTNENPNGRLVRATEELMRASMWAYIRAKREEGYKLSEIVYCWAPVRAGEGA